MFAVVKDSIGSNLNLFSGEILFCFKNEKQFRSLISYNIVFFSKSKVLAIW